MSLVSVIIAVYNCEKYICQSLDSALHQTHSDLEILVGDDSSDDNTWKILLTYKDNRIKLYRNETNRGVVNTRNFLLDKARGEFIIIQDGDDWSELNRIETLLDIFSKDKSLGACGTAYQRVDNKGSAKVVSRPNSFYLILDDCNDIPFVPATLMFRYSVYAQLGGYNEYFSGLIAEDLYWVVRLLEKHKVYYLNSALYYYRFNPSSITNSVGRKEKLIALDLIRELLNQRKSSGTDWIELNDTRAISQFALNKFSDAVWLSEKYRELAAVQRDGKKRWIALKIILKAIMYNPLAFQNYVTLKYVLF